VPDDRLRHRPRLRHSVAHLLAVAVAGLSAPRHLWLRRRPWWSMCTTSVWTVYRSIPLDERAPEMLRPPRRGLRGVYVGVVSSPRAPSRND